MNTPEYAWIITMVLDSRRINDFQQVSKVRYNRKTRVHVNINLWNRLAFPTYTPSIYLTSAARVWVHPHILRGIYMLAVVSAAKVRWLNENDDDVLILRRHRSRVICYAHIPTAHHRSNDGRFCQNLPAFMCTQNRYHHHIITTIHCKSINVLNRPYTYCITERYNSYTRFSRWGQVPTPSPTGSHSTATKNKHDVFLPNWSHWHQIVLSILHATCCKEKRLRTRRTALFLNHFLFVFSHK